MPFATTKLSSKGQVVIPEEIRKKLKLKSGAHFMVLGQADTIFLKIITEPSRDRLELLLEKAVAGAKKQGLRKASVKSAIKLARRKP